MKNVANMYVMQVRFFAPDVIPYRLIIAPRGTDLLTQALGLSSASWQEGGEYAFQNGTLEYQERIIPIIWLSFQERRMVIQVLGDSAAADAVYSAVTDALADLAPGFRSAAPLALTQETSCAIQLDFEWSALFSPALVEQISEKLIKDLSSEQVERFLKSASVRFTFGGVARNSELSEHGIGPSDQPVLIETRVDVPLSERAYFTYSPYDSDTHLELVSRLEASLAKGSRKGGRTAGGRS